MRILTAALVALLATTALAEEHNGDIAVHAGLFSTPRDSTVSAQSMVAGAEYRFADIGYGLRPTVGALGNTDAAMYAYGGFNYDLPISSIAPFVVTAGLFAGAYSQGDSKDLGSWFEFRETLEVSYAFESGHRIGASLSHLSNAGLGDKNPGTETVQLVYSFPLH